MQKFDHNIGFWEKSQFFRRKLQKIEIPFLQTKGGGAENA
jgi:hypothetical protein